MAHPYQDMLETFRDAARVDVTPEAEEVFQKLFQMTVQQAIAGPDGADTWQKARPWVLKQTAKIAREASSNAEHAGKSELDAPAVARACDKMIPIMHGSCEKALEGSEDASYGMFCPMFVAFGI